MWWLPNARRRPMFGSQEAQLRAGTVSQEAVLTQQLVLPQAEQNLRDTQGQLSQGSVALIQSPGGRLASHRALNG